MSRFIRTSLKCFGSKSLLFVLLLILSACSNPKIQVQNDAPPQRVRLTPESAIMSDGYVLPVKTWSATGEPIAVVLAMHGFNDYSNAFAATARSFADAQITTYAIDQRGFGTSQQHGVWAGSTTMQSDLIATTNLLCEKHADLPVFVLGESMGGGLILSVLQRLESTCIRGVVLMAPAVWGWQVMPWWQTVPLRMLAHTMPETTLTGGGLGITPSDNDEMLRALGNDTLIIRETRIDAIYGLTDLMEEALVNSEALRMPALILYGAHDEIIPPEAFCEMLSRLPDSADSSWRLIFYPNGYHMLSRDLQGEVVLLDMVTWIHDQSELFSSSGMEVKLAGRLAEKLVEKPEVVQGKSDLMLPSVCDD